MIYDKSLAYWDINSNPRIALLTSLPRNHARRELPSEDGKFMANCFSGCLRMLIRG